MFNYILFIKFQSNYNDIEEYKMRKVLVLGVVGFGFLVGCLSPDERKAQAAQRAANQLATFRFLCLNDYGMKDNTPAMSACMQDMDKEASRRARDAHKSIMKNANDSSTSQVGTASQIGTGSY
jgi:hypothetical protein|tara:strand:- start:33 stop:401 length:369 start_codon:yes stop_codon:yes gene_type:complete